MRIDIITVPYRYDERNRGLGAGPDALVKGGAAERVRAAGHEVAEPVAAMLPDEEREPGQTAVNIGKLGAHTAALISEARQNDARVLALVGEDTAIIGVIAGMQKAHGADARIGIVWVDAHGDFNTPKTSYSGILAGMPLAILAGLDGPRMRAAAGQVAPIPTERILIAGARDLDNQEESLLNATSVGLVTGKQLSQGALLKDAINTLDGWCDRIVLHIDLDVLDPELVPSASTASPDGIDIATLVSVAEAVYATGKVEVTVVGSLNPGGGNLGKRSVATGLELIAQLGKVWR
ncbi:MAG: arginase family protein [Thermomicrobiales bacterium]|nr:arginase family protein [Thermomicrobiales bacterium]